MTRRKDRRGQYDDSRRFAPPIRYPRALPIGGVDRSSPADPLGEIKTLVSDLEKLTQRQAE